MDKRKAVMALVYKALKEALIEFKFFQVGKLARFFPRDPAQRIKF